MSFKDYNNLSLSIKDYIYLQFHKAMIAKSNKIELLIKAKQENF